MARLGHDGCEACAPEIARLQAECRRLREDVATWQRRAKEATADAPVALAHLDERGEWGVWCIPSHPHTSRWPEHWWGQFWSTKDKVAIGQSVGFDEAGARAEAAKQTKQDPGGAYRYEARPLLSE